MQAPPIPTAPNGINNIQPDSIPMAPIQITSQPPPPPAHTPTQQIPVTVPVQTAPPPVAPTTTPAPKRESKRIKIVDPLTMEDILVNFKIPEKPEKITESPIATISAPAPEYLISAAGGQIAIRK